MDGAEEKPPSNSSAVSSSSNTGQKEHQQPETASHSTGAALAVELPPAQLQPAGVSPSADQEGSAEDEEACQSSVPPSPLNIHSLLNRPFGDVMREIISGFQLKSTALVAAEQLRYLVFHGDHDHEVLGSTPLMTALLQHVREGPGLPVGGACMAVLAQLARTADGRAQLRAERALQPVLRFLSMPEVLHKANAEAALMLLQNASCDKLFRHALIKAGGIELLLTLLTSNPLSVKQQHPKVSAYLSGTLLNLVAGDGEGSPAKHVFVKAGGMEKTCEVLAEWGRYDCSPATLRLRLMLADVGRLQQYALKLHQTALDATVTSARSPHDISSNMPGQLGSSGAGSMYDAAGGGRVLPGCSPAVVLPEVLAMAGKGIPLGTPRMPASERITAVVLQHGRNNHDSSSGSSNSGGDEDEAREQSAVTAGLTAKVV